MGSPQQPTFEQIQTLEQAGKLQILEKSKTVRIKDGTYIVSMQLPRQAVSFVQLEYK
jgi:xylan 1,4-beta-xylosidase